MLPRRYIEEWKEFAPWSEDAQVEQDLVIEKGIYVVDFYYPIVRKGQARIRVQISAGHERPHLDKAIIAFSVSLGKNWAC